MDAEKKTNKADKKKEAAKQHRKLGMGKDIGALPQMTKRYNETDKQFPGAYKPD